MKLTTPSFTGEISETQLALSVWSQFAGLLTQLYWTAPEGNQFYQAEISDINVKSIISGMQRALEDFSKNDVKDIPDADENKKIELVDNADENKTIEKEELEVEKSDDTSVDSDEANRMRALAGIQGANIFVNRG